MTGAVARRRIRCRLEVGGRGPGHRVDEEQDDVRLGDREMGLLLDARLDRIVGVELEPAGVDDDEPPAVPLGVAVQAVAGGPGAVLDDRRALAEEPVEQGALADIRSADDRDDRDPASSARHGQAAPAAPTWSGPRGAVGSEVVRPAGVAARSSAAWASAAAWVLASGVPAISRMCSATSRRSSIGVDVPPVTPTMTALREGRRVAEVVDVLDLDRLGPGDLAQPGQLLGVGARPAPDDDHQVDLAGGLEGVLLAADRDRADGVDDLELVGPRDHEGGQLLELPGRLGRLRDERHPLAPRDGRLPLLLLVDDDRVGCEAEEPDHLGVLGRAEQDDRVAVLDELDQLALLLDDPRAGAVDDLEAALLGAFHDVRPDAVGADDDGRAVVDVVERFDGLDAEVLEVADDALVVDDLAEGMRRLAGGRRLLRLVDRLANAVAEAGALRDADFLDRSHGPIIARGPGDPDRGSSATGPSRLRWRGRRSVVGRVGGERRRAVRAALGRAAGGPRSAP